jgi:Flp pilus assembly protein TadB
MTRARLILFSAAVICIAAPAATAADKKPKTTTTPASIAVQITPVGRVPFPLRRYVIDLPSGQAVSAKRVQVVENGIGIGEFTFSSLASAGVSFGTILAIDASDSMKGDPESGALSAAQSFVSKRASGQEIGVVTFNGAVNVRQAPTVDLGQLHAAVNRAPQLAYGTHIFDAVSRSLRELASAKISAGSIVLLSDGADVGSRTTLAQVVAAAKQQKVRVFTVGLRSGAFDAKTLQSLATQTGGTFAEVSSPKELASIYSQLGTKLATEYALEYRSLAAPSSPVDVSVTLDGVGTGTSHYRAPTPSELPPYHRPFVRRFVLSGYTFILLALVVAGLIGLAVRLLLDAMRSRVVDRVRAFTEDASQQTREMPKADDWKRRATRARASGSDAARSWLGRFEQQLDIGRIQASSSTIIAVTVAGTIVAVILLGTISVFFAVLGFGVPFVTRAWVRWRVKRIRDQFADQLPPNLQVLASGLRAGFTLLGAFVAMVENAGEPSKSEFDRVVTDEQLGVPLEDAIRRVAVRMASRDLEQLALLAELIRTTGGNAAEVLDVIVGTVRERADIRRLVRTLTTQGRMARWILTALPIATGLAFWAIQPDIVGPTWHTSGGQIVLLIAAVLVTAGSYSIQKIIEIEV